MKALIASIICKWRGVLNRLINPLGFQYFRTQILSVVNLMLLETRIQYTGGSIYRKGQFKIGKPVPYII